MARTDFTGSLQTGHDEIDAQHLELADLYQAAVEAARAGKAPALQDALAAVVGRTREHFAFEERLMVATGYEERLWHTEAHRLFLADLHDLMARASSEAAAPLVRLWLESRCASWWKLHVRSNDAALGRHLLAASAAPAPAAAAAR